MIKSYRDKGIQEFIHGLQARRQQAGEEIDNSVRLIIQEVRARGDEALLDFTRQFDHVDLSRCGFRVAEKELRQAHRSIDAKTLQVIRKAQANIEKFHRHSIPQSWMSWEGDGVALGQRVHPLQRVGIYVPGGRAAYPSSLLMAAVPAQVAGVEELIVVSPCDRMGEIHPSTLAVCWELGIRQVYRLGGAQAVAAMAYGTATVPQVDKIVGPGNAYVATAKKMLYGEVSIDMVAGPSEVVIIADAAAIPSFIAADMLAQAEHDPMASSILITDCENIAVKVALELKKQATILPRREIAAAALRDFGAILITRNIEESAVLANQLAPEHLGLHLQDPWSHLHRFVHAGAIFLGHYSPEAAGDYWAGPNHILPTNGSARFFSPLRVEDFFKTSSIIAYTQTALTKSSQEIQHFARMEGLEAHARAIAIRTKS